MDNYVEIVEGAEYEIKHKTLGEFRLRVTYVNSDFIFGNITNGTLFSICYGGRRYKGDQVTISRALCTMRRVDI